VQAATFKTRKKKASDARRHKSAEENEGEKKNQGEISSIPACQVQFRLQR
jgi:hypothetical protein